MRLLPLFLLLATGLGAQGISFQHEPWANLLAKAKAENKLIFVDAFTTWCGPCKKLAREVFPDEKVGAYFNATFINAKIDMEKGEGIELATRYGVELYPTLLFIDGEGRVAHRGVGYQTVDDLLALARLAANPMQNLRALEINYANGERGEEFLYRHLLAKAAAADAQTGTLAAEYLSLQRDWTKERAMDVIVQFVEDPYTDAYRYFLKNTAAFEARYGADAVAGRREYVFQNYVQGHPDLSLEDQEKLIAVSFPEADRARMTAVFRMLYYKQQGDVPGFARAAVEYYDRFPSDDASELNEVAWLFYEHVDDPAQLQKALQWALRSVKIAEGYYNQDTVAALYYKLKKKKEAKKHAERAIELAKAAGEDASGTEELLKKIGN